MIVDHFASYRKPGGFLQFLLMYEASTPSEQSNIRKSIAQTDPGWAYLLKLKSLSWERILSWPEAQIANLWHEIPFALPLTIWISASEDQKKIIENSLPPSQRNLLKKHSQNVGRLPQEEIDTARLRLVSHAREQILKGTVSVEKFDPTLIINEKIYDSITLKVAS